MSLCIVRAKARRQAGTCAHGGGCPCGHHLSAPPACMTPQRAGYGSKEEDRQEKTQAHASRRTPVRRSTTRRASGRRTSAMSTEFFNPSGWVTSLLGSQTGRKIMAEALVAAAAAAAGVLVASRTETGKKAGRADRGCGPPRWRDCEGGRGQCRKCRCRCHHRHGRRRHFDRRQAASLRRRRRAGHGGKCGAPPGRKPGSLISPGVGMVGPARPSFVSVGFSASIPSAVASASDDRCSSHEEDYFFAASLRAMSATPSNHSSGPSARRASGSA